MSKTLTALFPMKRNSERIPGKNFKSLAGKPLVRWVLDTLLSVEEIGRIVINTDARAELAVAGVTDGGKVLLRDRKAELCGDSVSMNLVLADDIAATPSDLYLMTHTTNPLLSAATVRAALQAFDADSQADSLFSVTRRQARFYDADGRAINHDPANLIPTQELEPWFEENSCLYLFSAGSFRKTRARIGEKPLMFETPALESVDIDVPEDWAMAEALLEKRQRTQGATS